MNDNDISITYGPEAGDCTRSDYQLTIKKEENYEKDEKKLSKLIDAFEGYEKYVNEELTMKEAIEIFLEKHPTSALMEIISNVLAKKEV